MKVKIFYLTAFLYSWLVWGLLILFQPKGASPALLVSIGGAGTLIAVLVSLLFLYNRDDRIDYFHRIIRLRGVSPLMFAALLIPFIVHVISSGFTPEIDPRFRSAGWFYAAFLFLFGPLPEELAWRGIALDELSKRTYVRAQLIVAVLWGIWHLPIFFIPGSYQAELGIFSFDFWMFFIEIIPISIICGYIYLKSGRSIIMTMLFHYSINLSGEVFSSSQNGRIIAALIYGALAVLCLLSRESRLKSSCDTII